MTQSDNIIDYSEATVVPSDIKDLMERKEEALAIEGKRSTYIKEKVFKYSGMFWDKWLELIISGDKDDLKFAMSEYNKLQQKVLPTQIEDGDGNRLFPQIINYINPVIEKSKEEKKEEEVVEK